MSEYLVWHHHFIVTLHPGLCNGSIHANKCISQLCNTLSNCAQTEDNCYKILENRINENLLQHKVHDNVEISGR